MRALLILPFVAQAILMSFDEFYFHRRRGLPRWERIGHPLDTTTLLICLCWVLLRPYGHSALIAYIGLAVFSTLFVTKDEVVHARYCTPGEHWVHSLQFILHPVLLIIAGTVWPTFGTQNGDFWKTFLAIQFFVILIFFFYQIFYWNFLWKTPHPNPSSTTPSMTI